MKASFIVAVIGIFLYGLQDLHVERHSPNSSSTYNYINSHFEVVYGGGDGAYGDWGSDSVRIGGANLRNAQSGVAYNSTLRENVLGVSYEAIEGRQTFTQEPAYPNLPILLVRQGYIASRAFTLCTNDGRSASGSLLFGGIDASKFYGQLVTIDLVPSGFDGFSGVVDFSVLLQGVMGTDDRGNPYAFVEGSNPVNILVDSGSVVTLLPGNLTTSIWDFVGATPDPLSSNTASIPFSEGSTKKIISFALTGFNIDVPYQSIRLRF